MSTSKHIWHKTQLLSLLLRRYIGWIASSLVWVLLLYRPFNLQPILHNLSKKILRTSVIHINLLKEIRMWKFFSILLLILLSLVRAEVQEFPIIENKKGLQDFEHRVIVWQPDGSSMVLIPASSDIQTFYMDKYEVTNAQYLLFLQATGHPFPAYWDDPNYNQSDQPVVGINWYDANAYSLWSGKRLPTEAEWEWAARGGLQNKKYPWGDERPNSKRVKYNDKIGQPSRVGSYSANGYGLHDMSGNVWEWCQNWFDTRQNSKSLRGGSWKVNKERFLHITTRSDNTPSSQQSTYGFRCAISLDQNNSSLSMNASIPDKNLRNKLKQKLLKSDDRSLQLTDMTEATGEIELSDSDIESLIGLESCTNLRVLSLDNNRITNISSLVNLTGLIELDLSNNQISDIRVLSNLSNLVTLKLSNNQITDFSPITKLTNLKSLYLENSGRLDIGLLTELTNLTELYLGNNQIKDTRALSSLTKLAKLKLDNNLITNIDPLSNLKNLDRLHLGNNNIISLEPISNLTNLTVLYLRENQISDISPVSDLVNLTMLSLGNNKIEDISALSYLVNLKKLHLGQNSVFDVSSLSNMSNLTELNLNNNEINEVNPLLNLTNLRVLNIQNNRLTESGGSIIDILKGNGIEIKHDMIPDSRSQKLLLSEEGKKQNRNSGPFNRVDSDYYTRHGAKNSSSKKSNGWLRSCMGGCFSCIGFFLIFSLFG